MKEGMAEAVESVPGVVSASPGGIGLAPRDLLTALQITAGRVPSKGIRFCSRGKLSRSADYPEILAASLQVGDSLRGRGLEAGERVAIILPTCPEFFPAFFGIMDGGGVPVPLPPPLRFSSTSHYLRKIRNALIKSRIRFILADPELARQLAPGFLEAGLVVTFLHVPDLLPYPLPGPPVPAPMRESVAPAGGDRIQPQALIQYTSGSTADSKGVVLTHAQVLANLESMRLALEINDADVGCSWLPLFHDMGLIGCALLCVYTGMDLWLMSPGDFLRAPENWLGLFGPRGITISPAPNSAFRHCLEKIPPARSGEFDLRSWRAAINGSEPIHLSTLQEFAARFSAAGFRPEAMLPVYGLAEATLAVTFSALADAPKSLSVDRDSLNAGAPVIVSPSQANAKHLISVGTPLHGMDVALADSDGNLFRGEDAVGEILVQGPSVMEGYDFDVAATETALASGWLKTGDMGFLHAGELYVTGRRKEMFIINGQNYYAHDFESLAQEVAGVSVNGVMAVKVLNGESESVVMILEARAADDGAAPAMVAGIREIVSLTLGISLLDVFVVKRGLLPKTSSGKLERHQGSSFYADVSGKYLSLR